MIRIHSKGSFKNTTKFLNFISAGKYLEGKLDEYGRKGVSALRSATPIDSGKTAESWNYSIDYGKDYAKIVFTNDNVTYSGGSSVPIAILIQYGHATKNGGYVQGREFINSAIQPIFDELADKVWKEVVNG